MSDLNELRCYNPNTGKRDGGYCAWEGDGKCMKCKAAEALEAANKRIAELEVRLTALADVADVVTHHLLFGQTNKAELESQIEMAKTLLGKSDE